MKKPKLEVGINGYRDWRLLLVFFCVMIVFLFGLAYYVLLVVEPVNENDTPNPLVTSAADKKLVDRALAYITERKKIYDSLIEGAPSWPDPSR